MTSTLETEVAGAREHLSAMCREIIACPPVLDLRETASRKCPAGSIEIRHIWCGYVARAQTCKNWPVARAEGASAREAATRLLDDLTAGPTT
jgi:hypothetical protein